MKQVIRLVVRKTLGIREKESVKDGLKRKKVKISRLLYRKKYNKEDLAIALATVGIASGDNVMVHAAYREFYNFEGAPEDIIEILIELVGESGTVLMPCYGSDLYNFDVRNTPSAAGVLSEVFRRKEDAVRSECTNFSICAYGEKAEQFTKEHKYSVYGFDTHSPYYLFAQDSKSKVVMLGLGKRPVKNTIFHLVGWLYKDKLPIYRTLFGRRYISILVGYDGLAVKKNMLTRNVKIRNSSKKMKKVFSSIPEQNRAYVKISNLNIVRYDARAAVETSIAAAHSGITIYNGL